MYCTTSGTDSVGLSSNSTGAGGISIGRAGALTLSCWVLSCLPHHSLSHQPGSRPHTGPSVRRRARWARRGARRPGRDYSRGRHNPANGLAGLWIIQIKLDFGIIWILDCASLDRREGRPRLGLPSLATAFLRGLPVGAPPRPRSRT